MSRSSRALSISLVVALSLIFLPSSARAQTAPAAMASLGDSITRGFNACGWYVDCTSRSWSTGDSSRVNSHYSRLLAQNPALSGKNHNDAATGATSFALPAQAQKAVEQDVEYVTILIGANDACKSTEAQMTAVDTYRQNIDAALRTLKSGVPGADIFVSSIPDIYQLWQVGKGHLRARTAWNTLSICQAMLADPRSNDDADVQRRDRVRQRVTDYNTELEQACREYGSKCTFDNNAVHDFDFTFEQLSAWDYFHPDVNGQKALADVTYQARSRAYVS